MKNIRIVLLFLVNVGLLIALVYLLKYQLSKSPKTIETPQIISSIVPNHAWQKTNTIKIASKTAHALAVNANGILLVGDDSGIRLYDKYGKQQATIALPGGITALTTDKETIYAALPRQIIKIAGNKLTKWPKFNSRALITAITTTGTASVPPTVLFIADAGNRKVYCYTTDGKKLWELSGTAGEKFIVPSPYFDISPDGNGGIWIVNPGMHRIENYTATGKFRALWEPSPAKTMLGCCNPAYLGVLSGDRFVTIEKGLIRSRLFAPSGKVIDTIVPATNFAQGRFKYDLTILPGNKVAILDSAGSKIDIYTRNQER